MRYQTAPRPDSIKLLIAQRGRNFAANQGQRKQGISDLEPHFTGMRMFGTTVILWKL